MTGPVWGEAYARKSFAFSSTAYWKEEAKEVLNYLLPWTFNKGCTLLDVGCNTGRLLEEAVYNSKFRPCFDRYIGMDVNESALDLARKEFSDIKSVKVDFIEDLNRLPTGSVQSVALMHVLPQIVDLNLTLSQVWHAMGRNSRLAVVIHNPYFDWLQRWKNPFSKYKADATMQREPTKAELSQLLWQAGFNQVSCVYQGAGFGIFKRRIIWLGEKK
jgi:SAM-dependent methyltransferase